MIIGITGYKSAGKGTAGQVLVRNYGFEEVSFAKPIKDLASQMFGIDRNVLEGNDHGLRAMRETTKYGAYGLTGRQILQELGTSLRNSIHPNIWVDMLFRSLDSNKNYVVTDVRFLNEVNKIVKSGGKIINIVRPGFNGDSHASERDLDNYKFEHQIINDKSMCELQVKMYKLLEEIL